MTTSSAVPIVLGSASPRRLELLERAGLSVEVSPSDVDETTLPGESAREYTLRVATDKAHHCARTHDGAIVVAADTTVAIDDQILTKPTGPIDAAAMLRMLSGRSHEVMTAVVVIDPGGIEHSLLAIATVTFLTLSDSLIDWYVGTGEPLDKAGAYGLQGAGEVLVERGRDFRRRLLACPSALPSTSSGPLAPPGHSELCDNSGLCDN
ncbi:MAG: nucleoside triphosphate pyrophosphatase [Microthrixaceae bacterium]